MLVNFIIIIGGLYEGDLVAELVFFGADGVIVFQGFKTGVTMQLIKKHAPFVTGIHHMAHICNLVMQSFFPLPLVAKIKGLLQGMYVYFFHSPKRQLEHVKLVKILQTKGLKVLCNVKTWWISMLAPIKLVLVEYKSLVVKMGDDMARNAYAKQL
jgi:hypothetical protein